MHEVFAHSNLERLITDSIEFSVLIKILRYLVIVTKYSARKLSVRENLAYLSSAKHDLHITLTSSLEGKLFLNRSNIDNLL